MYNLGAFTDMNKLKLAVASDPWIISEFASFANALGFGWCGGTANGTVGTDFTTAQVDADTFTASANYRASDPYAGGYMATTRLVLTFSKFTIRIDPTTLVFAPPTISSLTPLTAASYTASNGSDTDITASKTFSYQLSDTISHTTEYQFTEGIAVTVEGGVSVPLLADGKTSVEVSFSASQGWSDTTTTETTTTDDSGLTVTVPPRSSVQMTLLVYETESNVTYTGQAEVAFNVTLGGFLRWGGNGASSHPTDRPYWSTTFGTLGGVGPASLPADQSAFEAIVYQYQNQSTAGSLWDWGWINGNSPGFMPAWVTTPGQGCLNPVGVAMSGSFTDVSGTSASAVAGPPQPYTPPAAAPAALAAVAPPSVRTSLPRVRMADDSVRVTDAVPA